MFPIVYASASTARFVEQALIDTDPSDETVWTFECKALCSTWDSSHYYCDPIKCKVAAQIAFEDYLDFMTDFYNGWN